LGASFVNVCKGFGGKRSFTVESNGGESVPNKRLDLGGWCVGILGFLK